MSQICPLHMSLVIAGSYPWRAVQQGTLRRVCDNFTDFLLYFSTVTHLPHM